MRNQWWMDKAWVEVRSTLELVDQAFPMDDVVRMLCIASPRFIRYSASELIWQKHHAHEVEVFERGRSRRRKGMLFVRLVPTIGDQGIKGGPVTADDLRLARTGR